MLLHCPSCSARFDVPADQAANPGVTFRCTKCSAMFGVAQGLGAPASRSASASMSRENHLPPPRGLTQASGDVPRIGALPPSPVALGSGPPGGGGLPGGFRGEVFDSSANQVPGGFAPAATSPGPVSQVRDGLPASRGVSFDSQPSVVAAQTQPAAGHQESGVPVQPIDAETFFDDDPAVGAGPGLGGFTRSETGLREPQPSASVSASGFAAPVDGDTSFGQSHPSPTPGPRSVPHAAHRAPDSFSAPPATAGVFAFPLTDSGAPGEASPPAASFQTAAPGLGSSQNESGLWGAADAGVIALPDVPMPSSFDSTQVAALPRQTGPDQPPGQRPPTGGIRQLSRSSTRPISPQPDRSSVTVSVSGPSFQEATPPAESDGRSTAFRLSDLDGETGFELDPGLSARVRRTDPDEDEGNPVTNKIDPLVEFHDVFQDIRKAEKGDDRSATERYFDTGLFSGVEGQSAEKQEREQREREDRQTRVREGRLNLKAGAGGLADRLEKEVSAPDFEAEDDDMLAAALADSGLREPSVNTRAVAANGKPTAMVDLNIAGESAAAPAFPNAARYLSVLLVLVLAFVGTLGFIAMSNDGVLDLRGMNQMMGVAFRGETYEPRHQSVVQIVQTSEGWVEETLAEAPTNDGNTLAVGDLVSGQYEAGHGVVFTLVDGTVTNAGDARYRAIAVEVRLLDGDGEAVVTRVVPAGAPMDQPLMEEITDSAGLDAEYARLATLVGENVVEPTDGTTFSGAFLLDAETDVSSLTASARVVRAERPRERWSQVEFSAPAVDELPPDGEEE